MRAHLKAKSKNARRTQAIFAKNAGRAQAAFSRKRAEQALMLSIFAIKKKCEKLNALMTCSTSISI